MAGQDFAPYGVGLTYSGFSVASTLCVPDRDVNGWRNRLASPLIMTQRRQSNQNTDRTSIFRCEQWHSQWLAYF